MKKCFLSHMNIIRLRKKQSNFAIHFAPSTALISKILFLSEICRTPFSTSLCAANFCEMKQEFAKTRK